MVIYPVGFTAGQWSTKNNEKCSYCRCFILSQGCSKPGKILYLFLKGTYDWESLQKEHKNQNTKMSQHRESDAIYHWTKKQNNQFIGWPCDLLAAQKNKWQTLKATVFPFNYFESINFERKVIERIIHSRVQFCALMKINVNGKDLFYEGDIFANAWSKQYLASYDNFSRKRKKDIYLHPLLKVARLEVLKQANRDYSQFTDIKIV